MYEFGGLRCNENITQKDFNELMLNCLLNLNGRSVIINTITKTKGAEQWQRLLTKCPYFTAVKKFLNPNSNNEITIWISNNIIKK